MATLCHSPCSNMCCLQTPGGKIDTKALPLPDFKNKAAGGAKSGPYVAPKDDIEKTIQGIWMEVLATNEPLSTAADFYQAGK